MMKNFNDFIDTITQADIIEIEKTLNEISNEKTTLGTKFASQQFTLTLHLLHRYHDWLHSDEDTDK